MKLLQIDMVTAELVNDGIMSAAKGSDATPAKKLSIENANKMLKLATLELKKTEIFLSVFELEED